MDPVDLTPIPPLIDSYVFHSTLPGTSASTSSSASVIASTNTDTIGNTAGERSRKRCKVEHEPEREREQTQQRQEQRPAEGEEGGEKGEKGERREEANEEREEEGWIMGIDEAGRGPVLGPMVYAAAYCPMSFQPTLEQLGFDDSKALSAETRQILWEGFATHSPLCYSSAVLSPQDISAGMLRRVPINLNHQAEDATICLIRSALERNIPIKECYVDALGPSPQWQARLSAIFPTVTFTVCPKADSLFKIVSAASIIAKVTRDRYVHSWIDPEDSYRTLSLDTANADSTAKVEEDMDGKDIKGRHEGAEEAVQSQEDTLTRGSGYPSDPRTQAYLQDQLDPVFGYKGIVRFSWATVKVLLEKQGVECRWIDDTSQPSAASWFGADADAGRPKMWRDLGVSGVGEL